ncbi:hypothetical protein J505_3251 [Acinetobacter baumannii 1297549]|nr:hypothetical protein J505_3251 [Acinetobacter baumannii 1297549]
MVYVALQVLLCRFFVQTLPILYQFFTAWKKVIRKILKLEDKNMLIG